MKIKIIYLLLILFLSCKSNPIGNSSEYNSINQSNINWFYDVNDEELLIQIDTGDISSSISSLKIKLYPFHDDFLEIFDDGSNYDLISDNNIYSMLIEDLPSKGNYILYTELIVESSEIAEQFQYNINFNTPTIIDDSVFPYIPSQHILDQDDITFLDLVVAISDDDGSSDIEYVKYHIKKVNFNNGILLDNGECDYESVQEDNYMDWDPTWIMSYESTNTNGDFLYRVQQPMNPFKYESGCGGFGEIQFKFEVKDSKGFSDILELDDITEILLP